LEAVPVAQRGDQIVMAFREPPTKELLARYEQEFGSRWRCNWRLRPTSPSPATAPTPGSSCRRRANFFTDQFKQFPASTSRPREPSIASTRRIKACPTSW